VLGYTIAVLMAGLIGVLLIWTMYRSLPKPTNSRIEVLSATKTMLKYGLPISVGAILTGFLLQFYHFILPIYVIDDEIIGNYGLAQNFVVLITFFATPVTTMMLPAFSKLDYQKDKGILRRVFQYSVKYAALLVVPVSTMVISLSQPIIGTIFQDRYAQAPLFLSLLSISYLYSALGYLSIANLINGQGYTKYTMKLTILTVAIGFPLSFIMVRQFGVIGLILATLTAVLPSLLLSLRFIKKQFGVSIDWISSAKILFSSAFSALLTYITVSRLPFSSPIELAIGVVVFLLVFMLIALIIRTVSKTDIANLREIFDALGPLRIPLNKILNIIEKFMTVFHLDKGT
jgi:O-antigen/teichoic acid export membrane protein